MCLSAVSFLSGLFVPQFTHSTRPPISPHSASDTSLQLFFIHYCFTLVRSHSSVFYPYFYVKVGEKERNWPLEGWFRRATGRTKDRVVGRACDDASDGWMTELGEGARDN